MDALGFWLLNGVVALILISSFILIVRGNLFENNKHRRLTLAFLFLYITPLILIVLYSSVTVPSYKYEYGKTWISLLEVGNAKLIVLPLFIIGVMRVLFALYNNKITWLDFFIQLTFVLFNIQHVSSHAFKHSGFEILLINNIQPGLYLLPHLALLIIFFKEAKSKHTLSQQLLPTASWLLGLSATYIWKIYEAKRLFRELPAEPPGCFIVTAAGKGHKELVGSFYSPAYNKVMTRQLIIFYQFEFYLMEHFPRFHKGLRKVYNHIGPKIAKRIRTQWIADAVYLLLKPLEYMILLILMLRK